MLYACTIATTLSDQQLYATSDSYRLLDNCALVAVRLYIPLSTWHLLDNCALVTVEERKQQRADMSAVDVRVRHQDDSMIAQLRRKV